MKENQAFRTVREVLRRGVQLCTRVESVPDGDEWLWEVKYDGYRMLVAAVGGRVRLYSRNGKEYTERFPRIAAAVAKWSAAQDVVLDGELTVPDENGKTDFQALQACEKSGAGDAVYMAFDILYGDGKDLRALPLWERKRILDTLCADAPACVQAAETVAGDGKRCAAAARAAGLEGVVGKRKDAPYRSGRGGDWIKYKCYHSQEFVLGGYTRSQKRESPAALLLGVYEAGNAGAGALRYAGKAGASISQADAAALSARLSEFAADGCPFADPPKLGGEQVVWLRPALVGEVRFAEWTHDNRLRQAVFLGLRDDKSPEEVVREQSAPAFITAGGVRISSPQKILYPADGITKADVARYYAAAAERILPMLADRVVSVVRCHTDITQGTFFGKHPTAGSASAAVTVPGGNGKTHTYFTVDSVRALLTEVQLGAVEFHIGGSKISAWETPDTMVFDLDPDEGLPLARLREGVREVAALLASLSLPATLRTSGGKGYHVAVDFPKRLPWEEFRAFAKQVATLAEARRPDLFTADSRKVRRRGKIFLDWGRNVRGATFVAPYSLRARPGAPVAYPISWDELDTTAPDSVRLSAALSLFAP